MKWRAFTAVLLASGHVHEAWQKERIYYFSTAASTFEYSVAPSCRLRLTHSKLQRTTRWLAFAVFLLESSHVNEAWQKERT
jgi:hypothetical protein